MHLVLVSHSEIVMSDFHKFDLKGISAKILICYRHKKNQVDGGKKLYSNNFDFVHLQHFTKVLQSTCSK